jgi:hypothetical protein
MPAIENFSVLTAVGRDGDNLILRLDTDGQSEHDADARALMVVLNGCADAAATEIELRAFVGKPVEYGLTDGAVWVLIDYGWEEREIPCSSCTETEADLTMHDLLLRSRCLAGMANMYAEMYYQENSQLTTLVGALSGDVARELDRARRKLQFFHGTNPTREAVTAGQISAYERIEKLVTSRGAQPAA